MPADGAQLGDWILKVFGGVFAGKAGLGVLKPLFSSPPEKDLVPCNTRIVRTGRGAPFAMRAALHCTKAGQIELTALTLNRPSSARSKKPKAK